MHTRYCSYHCHSLEHAYGTYCKYTTICFLSLLLSDSSDFSAPSLLSLSSCLPALFSSSFSRFVSPSLSLARSLFCMFLSWSVSRAHARALASLALSCLLWKFIAVARSLSLFFALFRLLSFSLALCRHL